MDKLLIDICNKKINKQINESWDQIADVYGYPNGENLRQKFKKYRKSKGILPSRNILISKSVENKLSEVEIKRIELEKERIKLRDEKNRYKKLLRDNARDECIHELIINEVANIALKKPLINNINPIIKNTDNTGLLQLSDWHYSIIANNFLNVYNADIFNKRIKKVVEKTIEYGDFFNIEELYILLQGDFISGGIRNIIRIQNQEDTISQVIKTSEVLAEILNTLSSYFKTNVSIVTDNHSRITPDKKDSLNEENYIRITEWFLKERFKNRRDINFLKNEIGLDISTFKIYDYTCGSIHGDKDKFNNVVNRLTTFTRKIYDYIFTSHNHHLNVEEINMVKVISNGSLSGVDEYSYDLRMSSTPLQNFIVFNKEEGLKHISPIKV